MATPTPLILNGATELVDVSTLKTHPRNPRRGNLDTIRESIRVNGFYGVLVAQRSTRRILAGNHRFLAARDEGHTSLPVVWVDVGDTEALRILAADNRTSDLGGYDDPLLASLLAGLSETTEGLLGTGYDLEDMARLSDASDFLGVDLGNFASDDNGEERDADHAPASGVPDTVWPSDNLYGIPLLLDTHQADALDQPILVWGDSARSTRAGTYLLFTDDYKFEALWKDPTRLPDSGTPTAAEPNFSTGPDTPLAVALWGLYRKRYIARFWQSRGVRILVDINVEPHLHPYALLGVPKTWRAWITRLHAGDDPAAWLEACWGLVCEHTHTDTGHLFAVYGGGESVRQQCLDRGWWWVPERKQVFDGKWSEDDYVTGGEHGTG